MTKLRKIESKVVPKPEKPRKLSKAEEEEYTRQLNEVWKPIAKSIEEGKIRLPWWRENE